MVKELLPDALWARIAPLLPPEPPKPKGGRPRREQRAALDSAAGPARRGQETGKTPTDRGKQGTKRHLVADAHGIPLAVLVSAAPVHDSKMMLATVDAIESIRARTRGRPCRRPHKLHDDRVFDYPHLHLALRKRRTIARCGVEPKNRLGRYRWVVERTLSWLNRFSGA